MTQNCGICKKLILSHASFLCCSCCTLKFHVLCIPNLCKNDNVCREKDSLIWYCTLCIADSLPFTHIDDDDEFFNAIVELRVTKQSLSLDDLNELLFNPFEMFDDNRNSIGYDCDPDLNFYNSMINTNLNCDYFLEDSFNDRCKQLCISNKNFSIIHVNIRSMMKNFDNLREYLDNFSVNFGVLGITETWLNNDTVNLIDLPGYHHVSNHRTSKKGGGVSFLIRNDISYSVLDELKLSNEYIECLFIETPKEVIGVVYRPPNTNIQKFNDHIESIFHDIKQIPKRSYIVGDFNINLLNAESNLLTSSFLDLIFSLNYMPLINKPTRVTNSTATIIDNIFSNNYQNTESFNGILVSDISDHYPVFHICLEPNTVKKMNIF